MQNLTFYEKQRTKGRAEADGVINGITIGFRVWSSNGTTDEENDFARRLVASFNLCAEIPVENLENGTVKELMGEVMAQNARLLAQNAQLLEALDAASGKLIEELGEWRGVGIAYTPERLLNIRRAQKIIESAIAAATKTETP